MVNACEENARAYLRDRLKLSAEELDSHLEILGRLVSRYLHLERFERPDGTVNMEGLTQALKRLSHGAELLRRHRAAA